MDQTFDLNGKTAIVTGASSGLGDRFARILAKAGAHIVLCARRADRLSALVSDIRAKGGSARAIACDVTDADSIVSLFDQVGEDTGPAHILVNNAGMNVQGLATDLSVEDLDQIFNVNTRGVYLCAREAAKRLMGTAIEDTGAGRVINIASIGANTVLPGLTAYCASKAAVAMMTKGFAREWARRGITCNAICPGYIETEINSDWFQSEGGERQIASFPRKRLMRDSDLDAMLLYLASDQSSYVTGSVFTLDDGQSL